MASPDTDELATVPLLAGNPEAEQVRPHAPEPRARGKAAAPRDAEAATAPQEQVKLGRAAAGPRDAETETAPPEEAAPEQLPGSAADAPTAEQERVAPERIEPADISPDVEAAAPPKPAKDRGRWWRGLTGSLAAGLAVLAVGVLAVGVVCLFTGAPGPGATLLIGHPVAAVLALLAQRVADRRNGPPAVGAGVAVVLFTVSALTLFWLA